MKRLFFLFGLFAVFAAVYSNDGTKEASPTTSSFPSSTGGKPSTSAKGSTTSGGASTVDPPTTTAPSTVGSTTPPPGTTSAAVTTSSAPTPSPAPSSSATRNEYIVETRKENVTCLMANMTVAFVNETNNAVTNVTSTAQVDDNQSSCGKLTVRFGNNSFSLIFKNESSSYNLDTVVANINGDEANATGLNVGRTSFMTSYVCLSGINVTLNNNITFVGTEVQFQAFGVDVEKKAFSTATTCVADIGNNIIIPIAVGCAVAGLIILVVIAYMIGRRRMKHRYEAM